MNAFECALTDQFNNNAADTLWLHNSYDVPEEMPVDVFFRNAEEMPELEHLALKLCRGKTLDIGAGVGSHSLLLQRKVDVTALEISETACNISRQRGVKKVINENFFEHKAQKYDTLLMLMNGIGLAGSIKQLPNLLKHCSQSLNKNGQILFDSSDISYLYEDLPFPENKYYGEVSYRYQYKGEFGNWFDWLYVDIDTLEAIVSRLNLQLEILLDDGMNQYLGRITHRK